MEEKEAEEIPEENEPQATAEEIVNSIKKEEKLEIKKEEIKEKKKKAKPSEEKFMEILRKTSFGTKLREALEKIAQGKSGVLIVLSEPSQIKKIMLGGFSINCKFTIERLVELSKLDGAIIVDPQLKKIYYANILLIPSPEIQSQETGTRHQAAERTAKQTGKLVLAVSEKTGIITLYSGDIKYSLKSIGTLITRVQSVLDSLDEQKKIFNNLANYLNILEFTNLVTAVNVVSAIQKAELITRGHRIARRYLTELGAEGHLLELRLKEIMKNVEESFFNLIKDYRKKKNVTTIRKELSKLNHDFLLEFENILKIFEFKALDEPLQSKGFRILSKIASVSQKEVKTIVNEYGALKDFLDRNVDDIKKISGIGEKKIVAIKKELIKLRDSAVLSQNL